MAEVTLQQEGARVYVLGSTYPIKGRIKSAGGHWDADRRAWWVGRAKRAEIEAALAASAPSTTSAAPEQRPSDKPSREARVKARASYKGKEYYVLANSRDGSRLLLAARNGEFQFWAAAAQLGDRVDCSRPIAEQMSEGARIVRTYGREDYRSGRTEYPTLGSMIDRAAEWGRMSREEREEAREDAEARRAGDACPCSHGACRCGSDSPCCMCW